MIHYEQCPLCDSASIHKALSAKDHTVSKISFEIWQCAHCSARFTQDVPSLHEISAYYKSENYISHTDTNKGLVNWLYLQVRKFTLRIKHRFVAKETGVEKGTVLDIGAGTGAFLNYMRSKGWSVEGLEPDEQAISRAASQYNLMLRHTTELFSLKPETFDAITLWHVLEHVHDLHGYLTQIKKLLKKDGLIFIAVPNFTSFDAEKYGASWAAYDVPRHLYHFSPAAMQQLVGRHGLGIRKMQPMWFDSFYVSLLSEKYRHNSAGLISGCINGLKSNAKAWSHSRKASSIIYVVSSQVPA